MMVDATKEKERDQVVEDSLNSLLEVEGEQGHHTLLLVPVPRSKAKEKERANLKSDATKANLPTAHPQATAHKLARKSKPKKPVHIVVAITLPATVGNDKMRKRRMG